MSVIPGLVTRCMALGWMSVKILGMSIVVLAFLGVACAIGISLFGGGTAADMKASENATVCYTVSAPFPSVPGEVILYRVVPPEITAENVSAMAGAMGLEGTVQESSGRFFLSDNPYLLEVQLPSGQVTLIDTPRWMNSNDRDLPENLPSDDEAARIATRYLEDTGLMPPDAILGDIVHPKVINRKTVATPFEDVQVSYFRRIDGRPVVGSELTVEVGGGGDILYVSRLWRDVVPQGKVSIMTPREAFETLKTAGMPVDVGGRENVNITGIKFGYYEAPAVAEPAYLVPVYIFVCEVPGGTTKTPFIRCIPASPNVEADAPGWVTGVASVDISG